MKISKMLIIALLSSMSFNSFSEDSNIKLSVAIKNYELKKFDQFVENQNKIFKGAAKLKSFEFLKANIFVGEEKKGELDYMLSGDVKLNGYLIDHTIYKSHQDRVKFIDRILKSKASKASYLYSTFLVEQTFAEEGSLAELLDSSLYDWRRLMQATYRTSGLLGKINLGDIGKAKAELKTDEYKAFEAVRNLVGNDKSIYSIKVNCSNTQTLNVGDNIAKCMGITMTKSDLSEKSYVTCEQTGGYIKTKFAPRYISHYVSSLENPSPADEGASNADVNPQLGAKLRACCNEKFSGSNHQSSCVQYMKSHRENGVAPILRDNAGGPAKSELQGEGAP